MASSFVTSALIEKTAAFLQCVCARTHMCPPCLYLPACPDRRPSPSVSELMPLGPKRLCTELCCQRDLGLSAASPEGFCPPRSSRRWYPGTLEGSPPVSSVRELLYHVSSHGSALKLGLSCLCLALVFAHFCPLFSARMFAEHLQCVGHSFE